MDTDEIKRLIQDGNVTEIVSILKSGLAVIKVLVESGNLNLVGGSLRETQIQNLPNQLLEAAVIENSAHAANFMLEKGADVNYKNAKGEPMVLIAAKEGYDKCLKVLIRAGADLNLPNTRNQTALSSAVDQNNPKCLDFLIKAGADVNRRNGLHTALMGAIIDGHEKCAELLISFKRINFEVHCRHMNLTALMYDIWYYRDDLINLLLKRGANPAILGDDPPMNSLMTAAVRNYASAMEAILKTGRVDVNAKDAWGSTALMCTKEDDTPQKDSVATSFLHGAHVNATNPNLLTSLLMSYEEDQEDESLDEDLVMLLYVAGEIPERGKINHLPKCLQETESDMSLKNLCRQRIRKHLLDVDRHTNFFMRNYLWGCTPLEILDYLHYYKDICDYVPLFEDDD